MSKKKLSKEKSFRRTQHTIELTICLIAVAAGGFWLKNTLDRASVTSAVPGTHIEDTDIEIPSDDPEIPTLPADSAVYESIFTDSKNMFQGNLILVNNQHKYLSNGNEDLVSIIDMNEEKDIDYFTAVDNTYTIIREVYQPMVNMIHDFYEKYYNDTLIIYGSFRTHDFQQQLYEEDLEKNGEDSSTLVAKPGYSEHETGYAFDFSETTDFDYQGTGDFAWLNENCYKYGFIIRYTEEKEKITEIRSEPWHFRYVGIPHAYYMTKNNLCLEEYIELIGKHPQDGEHLVFTDENKQEYEVYFVPADASSDKTMIPVPSGVKYEISGNNIDGFIVTVYKNVDRQSDEHDHEHSTEPTSEAETTENTSAEDENSENAENADSDDNGDDDYYADDENY